MRGLLDECHKNLTNFMRIFKSPFSLELEKILFLNARGKEIGKSQEVFHPCNRALFSLQSFVCLMQLTEYLWKCYDTLASIIQQRTGERVFLTETRISSFKNTTEVDLEKQKLIFSKLIFIFFFMFRLHPNLGNG